MKQTPDEVARCVARRIAEVRVGAARTQAALAKALGVSVQRVRRIELAQTRLTVQALASNANVLGVDAIVLFRPPATLTVLRGRPPRRPARTARLRRRLA